MQDNRLHSVGVFVGVIDVEGGERGGVIREGGLFICRDNCIYKSRY